MARLTCHTARGVAASAHSSSPARRVMGQVPKDREGQRDQSIAAKQTGSHDYHILDVWEAGTSSPAPKSNPSATDEPTSGTRRHCERRQVFLLKPPHLPYERGGYTNHRARPHPQTVAHRKEIRRLIGGVEREGLTLVPARVLLQEGSWRKVAWHWEGKEAARQARDRALARRGSARWRARCALDDRRIIAALGAFQIASAAQIRRS